MNPTPCPLRTVVDCVAAFMSLQALAVESERISSKTREWYRYQFAHVLKASDAQKRPLADRLAAELGPDDLLSCPHTWHFARAIRRLFRWAHESGHVPAFRFAGFKGPPMGMRERVMTDGEWVTVQEHASPALKDVLWFLRHTLARPGEARALRWCEVVFHKSLCRLEKFKAKERRRDGVRVRAIGLTPVVVQVMRDWYQTRKPKPDDVVFLNSRGRPWTSNALRLAMHRACEPINNQPGERVVAYTVRHTSATNAARNKVTDTRLAKIMGHTSTRTTARYLHLNEEDLVEIMGEATAGLDLPAPTPASLPWPSARQVPTPAPQSA